MNRQKASSTSPEPTDKRKELPTDVAPLRHHTPAERAAKGKAARAKLVRSEHAVWEPPTNRPDPVGLLETQAVTRIPELVPIRCVSQFAVVYADQNQALVDAAKGGRIKAETGV